MSTDMALSVHHITKRFLGTVALKDVSLDLRRNEILALIGENGAGKSTLMKILSGVYPHSEYDGEIVMEGRPCKFRMPSDAEGVGIAMIYQELNMELDLTVAENVLLGRYPKKKSGLIDWKKMREAASATLARLRAEIDISATVRSLSPSMQQLVSIARALYSHPRILILDEPTSVLTETETRQLMRILLELKEQGISCIYISHRLDEIFQLCDRVAILRDGEKVGEYEKDAGYDSKAVISDMIGRRLDSMYPKAHAAIGGEVLRAEGFRVPHPFAYGKSIVEDVSFSVRRGEILGLAGLVGSGRSELLSAVFGMTPKTAGEVYVDGRPVRIKSPIDAIRAGIGLLSEDRKRNGFVWTMRIGQNMTLAILNRLKRGLFVDQARERKIAGEYYHRLRVKATGLDALITSLSGGNQQKIILAKWLMTNLRVLFLDEPTRGIDVGTKAEIYSLISDLAAGGLSIVMVSSELPELIAMCDRFIVLGKGVVQAEIGREEANEVAIIQAASGTRTNE